MPQPLFTKRTLEFFAVCGMIGFLAGAYTSGWMPASVGADVAIVAEAVR